MQQSNVADSVKVDPVEAGLVQFESVFERIKKFKSRCNSGNLYKRRA